MKLLSRMLIPLSVLAVVAAGCVASSGGRRSKKDASSSATGEDPAGTGADPVVGGNTDGGDPAVDGVDPGADGADPGADGGPAADGVDPGADGSGDGGSGDDGPDDGGPDDGGLDDGGPVDPIEKVCEPGSVACDGADVVACKNDGSSFYVIDTCGTGTTCNPDKGSCVTDVVIPPANCPAGGTGIQVGDQIQDMTWTDTDGKQFNLHSFCGTKNAIIIFETAAW